MAAQSFTTVKRTNPRSTVGGNRNKNMNYDLMMASLGITNKINIVDDFLHKDYFGELKNLMMNHDFPWFRNNGVNHDNDGDRQFTHLFYNKFQKHSPFYENIEPIVKFINPISIIRIKANLLPSTPQIHEFGYHVDTHRPCVTAVLYINTNNGYTKFETGEKIKSVANRFVFFPSYMKHAGTTCSDEKDRVVINFNYYPMYDLW